MMQEANNKNNPLIKLFLLGVLLIGLAAIFWYQDNHPSTIPNPSNNVFTLNMGKLANYGASPWYTENISLGKSKMQTVLDSGSSFTWATSDLCKSKACLKHNPVATTNNQLKWIDESITMHSFGPWGSMYTKTANIPFKFQGFNLPVDFLASVSYTGPKFSTLAWGAGISFPSASIGEESGSTFFFKNWLDQQTSANPSFSILTNQASKSGTFYLGWDDPTKYDPQSEVILEPNRTGDFKFLWGTTLYSASLKDSKIPQLSNVRFFLDSGSSSFKGDNQYITPILTQLIKIKDKNSGKPIFKKVLDEDQNWTGLQYADGGKPSDYKSQLPNFSLTLGQSCKGNSDNAAIITLNPLQYSFKAEIGEGSGDWFVSFSVLDGVGGLLVGSTMLDLFYTQYNYEKVTLQFSVGKDDYVLNQGNMKLYKKTAGESPHQMTCTTKPKPVQVTSPLEGIWYNSYCSQVDLKVAQNKITGVYTSHSGSVGSSKVVGYVGAAGTGKGEGVPVAMGITWGLISDSVPQHKLDPSWRWASSFSGQLHLTQEVAAPGQQPFKLNETLIITNMLYATTKYKGFNTTAPVMFPEDLTFSKTPAPFCSPLIPPKEIPFAPNAKDHISGSWSLKGASRSGTLTLKVDKSTSQISGTYKKGSTQYSVFGMADPYKNIGPKQSLVLTLKAKRETGKVISMVGLVEAKGAMVLWEDQLKSTTWPDRFSDSEINKQYWTLKN